MLYLSRLGWDHFRLSVCPSVHASICVSVHPSVHQSACISVGGLSVRPSVHPPACLSVCPSFCLSVCLSIHLPVCRPTVNPFAWLSCPSIWLPVRPPVARLLVCFFGNLSVHPPSVCLSERFWRQASRPCNLKSLMGEKKTNA
jgi:hypothetical protein